MNIKRNSTKVYLLSHLYEYGENGEYEDGRVLGVYATKESAEEAIKRYFAKPGFRDHSVECFVIDRYFLDEDTGFVGGFYCVY